MKKILFSAFAFVALAFASCSESGGVVEKGDYTFSGSHLLFEYNLVGDFANMVEVIPSTTLPSTSGTATPSSDGTKHSLFISNRRIRIMSTLQTTTSASLVTSATTHTS